MTDPLDSGDSHHGADGVTLSIHNRGDISMGTAAKNSPMIDAQSALAAQAALATQGNGAGEASGVDKMRELLFGNQMQDYDKRFSILEDRFQLRMRDLESESSRGLTNLETTIKKQLESVAGQFREQAPGRHARDDRADVRRAQQRQDRSQSARGTVCRDRQMPEPGRIAQGQQRRRARVSRASSAQSQLARLCAGTGVR
jgi:hypothetical protein